MPSAKKPQREDPNKAPQVRPRIVIKFRDEVNLPYHKGAERVLNELGLAPWKNIVEAAPDATLEPVSVSVPEERVRELVNTARQRTSSYRPGNFFSFFALAATPGSDLQAVLRELKSWSIVENAYIDRGPSTPPAVNAGDDPRSAYQGYLSAAPIGIDAHYAWLWPGGDGEDRRFVDLVRLAVRTRGPGGAGHHADIGREHFLRRVPRHVCPWRRMRGRQHRRRDWYYSEPRIDSRGVRDARRGHLQYRLMQCSMPSRSWRPEMCCSSNHNFPTKAPSWWDFFPGTRRAMFLPPSRWPPRSASWSWRRLETEATIRYYTLEGVGHIFDPASDVFRDSGAIMVGAATSLTPHERTNSSDHGARIDCYAWGENIDSATSYADGVTDNYDSSFGGTSGASAIIAGAALAIQGIGHSSGLS